MTTLPHRARRPGAVRRLRLRHGSWSGQAMLGYLLSSSSSDVDAVRVGQVLLLMCSAVTAVSAPMLVTELSGCQVAVGIAVAMALLTALTHVLHWDSMPRRMTLVFPFVAITGLLCLGFGSNGEYAPLGGLTVLCFAYIGLTQTPGTSLLVLPYAGVAFTVLYGPFSGALVVRLLIACVIYVALGELLAALTLRQQGVTSVLRGVTVTDPLTGLYNKAGLEDRLGRLHDGTTVVICELDDFKRVNEERGQAIAHAALTTFARALSAVLRHDDFCSRFNGEQFVLVLERADTMTTERVLDRLREQCRRTLPGITFSAGITMVRAAGERSAPGLVLARADSALYAAKAGGHNCDRVA